MEKKKSYLNMHRKEHMTFSSTSREVRDQALHVRYLTDLLTYLVTHLLTHTESLKNLAIFIIGL